DAHPSPKQQLVELRTPPRDLSRLTPAYVSTDKPAVAVVGAPEPKRAGLVKVLQGRTSVQDALIDPGQPDRSLGAVPRDNTIRKAEAVSVFLVRFDLDRLGLQKEARIEKATISFFVWDPSSQGQTKVCALGMKTPWDEATATWHQAA